MKTYQFMIAAALFSTVGFVSHSATPISLPGLSWLRIMPSSLMQLCYSQNELTQWAQKDLWSAAHEGDLKTVKRYLATSTDNAAWKDGTFISPNYAHKATGLTPLMAASRQGHVDIVKALLSAGADPHVKCKGGLTARHYATLFGRSEAAKALIQASKADKEINDSPIVDTIAVNSTMGFIRECRLANVDPSTVHQTGNDALNKMLIAACLMKKSAAIVELLLQNDADVHYIDSQGNTALGIAIAKGRTDIINLLLCYGARPTDEQNRQLSQEQQAIITKRCRWIQEQLRALEHLCKLPRDLSRHIGTLFGLTKAQNL